MPTSVRRRLAAALGLADEEAGRWIAFWTGLHDIGKVSPAFQLKHETSRVWLQKAGLRCPAAADAPHGLISTKVLCHLLPDHFGLPRNMAARLAVIIGGHHGVFPSAYELQNLSNDAVGRGGWSAARVELARFLAAALDLPRIPPSGSLDHATAMTLAGFVSVADWIGSNEVYFRHAAADLGTMPELDPHAYAVHARAQARQALGRLGWLGWEPAHEVRTFTELFPKIAHPNSVQQAVITLAAQLKGPGLVVVEAPMGEGKTEAAMYLADRWSVALGQRGCYFALPTQATSNQMFGRVQDFLATCYPADIVNLHLLHGHAVLSAEFETLRRRGDEIFAPSDIWGECGSDGAPAAVVAAEWFTGRKRGLLAPFGVGTVDQALLAVLQTRHVFVRLFGLAGKTVIIDEVHAYDTYMTTLLRRLVEWLGALGTSVVLLSATLPRDRRQALVEAYARGAGWALSPSLGEAGYPRLTWTTASSSGAWAIGTVDEQSRYLNVVWVNDHLPETAGAPFALGERLRKALADGGCAAVICNTVGRAQRVYQALKSYFPDLADDGAPELDLLHARFLFEERKRREARVLRRFGKPGDETVRRPRRAVLVSTQIIEQSLDLDFDLIVTDLAPADLVLQRTGRLYRHAREHRPLGPMPTVWICAPTVTDAGVPSFDRGQTAVYDAHVLLRSWLALRDRGTLAIPADIEPTIEAVYGERPCPPEANEAIRLAWQTTWQALHKEQRTHEGKARQHCILPPTYDDEIMDDFNRQLEEDDPSVNISIQALTRLTDLTLPIIILDATHLRALNMSAIPSLAEAKELLRRSTTLTHKPLVQYLVEEESPVGWRASPLLRHHRLVGLDEDSSVVLGGGRYRLRLDDELGVLISANKETE